MMVIYFMALQMTVVEAYVGSTKVNPPDDSSKLHPKALSLINEGIAQNTTGNVFVPKVCLLYLILTIVTRIPFYVVISGAKLTKGFLHGCDWSFCLRGTVCCVSSNRQLHAALICSQVLTKVKCVMFIYLLEDLKQIQYCVKDITSPMNLKIAA